MARKRHGESVSLNTVTEALESVNSLNSGLGLASAPLKIYSWTPYDYLFPDLQQDSQALLPESSNTIDGLVALGQSMMEKGTEAVNSAIPSAYTYFGQFIDHDITLELHSDEMADLYSKDLKPLSIGLIREKITNRRSPMLDLDSVYGVTPDGFPVPRVCWEMSVGAVTPAADSPNYPGVRPPGMDPFNDVPRKPPAPGSPGTDREAVIGDGRNDENLILSQMHVAFLRAHNALLKRDLTFNEAKRTLILHYQWLIIHDFLWKVADRKTISDILIYGNRFFRPKPCAVYMPLEFSVAAFRFGHSMVRSTYDYNVNFTKETAATLRQLFLIPTFRTLSPTIDHIPEQWLIEWKNFLDGGPNVARKIDTRLVEPLSALVDSDGMTFDGLKSSLAVRNLLRGYLLRMPIGQRVAAACGIKPLSPDQILKVSSEEQSDILQKYELHQRTPLWYYILAEAALRGSLGPVGSTIVGEVLIGLIRWSDDSIFSRPKWKPTLGQSPGKFTLKDLFQLSGVWS